MSTTEVAVPQVDGDADTLATGVDERILRGLRPGTCSDWPPEPPPPAPSIAEIALAAGTQPRRAAFYPVVRRPTTSSDAR